MPKLVDGMVRAIGRGFDGSRVREIGEVFEFKGVLGSWMEPIEAEPAPAKPVKGKEPAPKAVE